MSYISEKELRDASVDAGTLNQLVNGEVDAANFNRKGVNVGTLLSWRDKVFELATAAANMQTYLTADQMNADKNQGVPTAGQVTNDPNPAINGFYVWDGERWLWSGVQPTEAHAVSELQRLTSGNIKLGIPGWLFAHIDELSQKLLMGLRENGELQVTGGLKVGGPVQADGVALVAPTVGDILEAEVGAGNRAISYWTKSGQRYQALGDGEFGKVYDPAWFSEGRDDQRAASQMTALQSLIQRCYNPVQDVNLVVIGDSISWGVGAVNPGLKTPRDHRLSDVRANLTCRSWVNLLREYLGQRYLDVPVDALPVEEVAPGALAGGSGSYSARQAISFAAIPGAAFRAQNEQSFVPELVPTSAPALAADAVELPPGCRVEFPVLSTGFDIYYQRLNDPVERRFSVRVDGALLKSVVFSSTEDEAWGEVVNCSLSEYKPCVLSIHNESNAMLRLEGIQRTKIIRVINQGISGTRSTNWLPEPLTNRLLLTEGVPLHTSDVIIALGTNDRRLDGAPNNTTHFESNMGQIVGWLQAHRPGVLITLLGAYATLEDSGRAFHQRDVARALANVAERKGVSVLSPYQQMRDAIEDGQSLYTEPDLLHPDNNGHHLIFKIAQNSAEIFTSR